MLLLRIFCRVVGTESRLQWVEKWAGGEKLTLDLAVKRKKAKGQYLEGDMRSCFYLFLKMGRFNTYVHLNADGKEPVERGSCCCCCV